MRSTAPRPNMCASLMPIPACITCPKGADEDALVMLSDILPTGFECGVLNGKMQDPGVTVAIVGAGPIGLATLLTAQFFSPAKIIMIDLDEIGWRLPAVSARPTPSTARKEDAAAAGDGADRRRRRRHRGRSGRRAGDLRTLRGHRGAGRHHRQCRRAWPQGGSAPGAAVVANIAITTRLVDTATTRMLLKAVASKKLDPARADHPPLHPRPNSGCL